MSLLGAQPDSPNPVWRELTQTHGQFMGVTFLQMCDSCLSLFYTCSPRKCLTHFYCYKYALLNLLCSSYLRNRRIQQVHMALPGIKHGNSMFKIDCAWAILGGLGGPLGSSANHPQTKPSPSIPRHKAQFARIMCLEK
jgi:hypothetical protein